MASSEPRPEHNRKYMVIVDQKLLKYSISNMAQLEEALKTVWAEISKDVTRKLFQSMPTRLRQVINNKGYACCIELCVC